MPKQTRAALRKTRSFSLDPKLLSEVERTRGDISASERVNQLLSYALEMERKAALYAEAADFLPVRRTIVRNEGISGKRACAPGSVNNGMAPRS